MNVRTSGSDIGVDKKLPLEASSTEPRNDVISDCFFTTSSANGFHLAGSASAAGAFTFRAAGVQCAPRSPIITVSRSHSVSVSASGSVKRKATLIGIVETDSPGQPYIRKWGSREASRSGLIADAASLLLTAWLITAAAPSDMPALLPSKRIVLPSTSA